MLRAVGTVTKVTAVISTIIGRLFLEKVLSLPCPLFCEIVTETYHSCNTAVPKGATYAIP